MKSIVLILFLIIQLDTPNENTLIPLPSIKAICQIELRNGKIKEGIITIVSGGIRYHSNGFVLKELVYESPAIYGNTKMKLFSMDQFELHFRNDGKQKIFYAINRTGRKPEKLIEEGEHILLKRYEEKFLMEKEIEISDKIPVSYPQGSKQSGIQKVKIKDIKVFRLLTKPTVKWLKTIEEGNKRLEIKYGYSEANMMKSGWYHDIMKNQRSRNSINNKLKEK